MLLRLEDLLHTGLADALLAAVPSAPAERLRSEDVPRPESRRAITMPCDSSPGALVVRVHIASTGQ